MESLCRPWKFIAKTKFNKNFRKYCEEKHQKTLSKIEDLKKEFVTDFITDNVAKVHHTIPIPGFIEKEYPAEYKVVCEDLLTQEQLEDYFKSAKSSLEIAEKVDIPEVVFKFAYDVLIKLGITLIARDGYKIRSNMGFEFFNKYEKTNSQNY